MATNVHLTPDLEQFARGCVESGRYNNVSEVLRSALRLLKDQEENRGAFAAMLKDVRREAKRKGVHSIEDVAAEMDAIVAADD
jgi:antitoxin ParD1/3/4